MKHTNAAYTNVKWLLCVCVGAYIHVYVCALACGEQSNIHLLVAGVISLQVTVLKDRTLRSRLMMN